MTTALDIITKAMQKNGILTKTEVPDADETADGLDSLNAMLSSWSNDSMMISSRVLESFTLTANVSQYTIGAAMDFVTTRPTFIVDAYVRQSTTDYPLEVVPDEVYANISVKSSQGIPSLLNYNNGYPTGIIKLYPTPTSGYTLYLLSEKVLSSFSLSDTVDLPAGWERALIYNLAVEIAPEYGMEVTQSVMKIANDSKGAIQRAILKSRTMDAQPAKGSKAQIYNGGFV